jgi:lipopolysaccharide/colanic/teichoic acid biosynthesis glycosyltransferase
VWGPAGIFSQEHFARTLFIERKRTERSGRSFALMLLESSQLLKPEADPEALELILHALSCSTRDTDAIGWHKEGSALGVIFTELGANADGRSVARALLVKITTALTSALSIDQMNAVRLKFHVFPENWDQNGQPPDRTSGFYDDRLYTAVPKPFPLAIKRCIDVTGSLIALVAGFPLFAVIAIAVKLSSRGPVLFRQQRLGQYGQPFSFLKFRSMTVDNDAAIHREYIKSFIADAVDAAQISQAKPTYKLAADPRVTPLGRFLRRTSLDELPQFVNVLRGEMSLVGPRPPLPYEAHCYDTWHWARLLAAKPGITGLWQVKGRSRVKFDDMVRMDLQYAAGWSLWLDIKILLQTPLAVFSGAGAH